MENLLLTTTISIKAPMAKVWHALTDKETIKQYFFGTEAISTWEVGTPLIYRGIWEGKTYEDKGTILDKIEGHYLKTNYWSNFSGTEDKPENYNNITYALEEKDGATVLTITQNGFKNQEALEHSKDNWNMVMAGLKELMEK